MSGCSMKLRNAYAALGFGASLTSTKASSQNSVPSVGTTYVMSADLGSLRIAARIPVQPRARTHSGLSPDSLTFWVSESRARMCGARSIRMVRAWSRSALSIELRDLPIILSGMTNTSPIESTNVTLPEYLPLTRSANSVHEVRGSVTSLLRTRMPVVPKSLGMYQVLVGSQTRSWNALLKFQLGIRDLSSCWMKPPSFRAGTYSPVGAC